MSVAEGGNEGKRGKREEGLKCKALFLIDTPIS
jgi:hypothetical protein